MEQHILNKLRAPGDYFSAKMTDGIPALEGFIAPLSINEALRWAIIDCSLQYSGRFGVTE